MTAPFWPLCRLTLFVTLLWMLLASLALIEEGHSKASSSRYCAVPIARYEKHHGIPEGLLVAIAKVEAGYKNETNSTVAWPWAVNAGGQGYYFPSKEAAITAVQTMKAKGIRNIDVGCMQINLFYHPHAFKTLADAFDPGKNVAYAAKFLTSLKNEHASWYTAVAHYHSANPAHHTSYRKNVLKAWNHHLKTKGILMSAGVFEYVNQKNGPSLVNRIRRLASANAVKIKMEKRKEFIPFSHNTSVHKASGDLSHIRRLKISG